jgi:hypothetical protein
MSKLERSSGRKGKKVPPKLEWKLIIPVTWTSNSEAEIPKFISFHRIFLRMRIFHTASASNQTPAVQDFMFERSLWYGLRKLVALLIHIQEVRDSTLSHHTAYYQEWEFFSVGPGKRRLRAACYVTTATVHIASIRQPSY